MALELATPTVDGLSSAIDALRDWQTDGSPHQLHPGDLGWFWRFGAEKTAASTRVWSRDGVVLAVGLLDEVDMLRVALAPDALRDEELTQQLVTDLTQPERGLLPAGKVYLESPNGSLLKERLAAEGWQLDAPWVPVRRDLTDPVEDPGLRVDLVGTEEAHERALVQRESFAGSTFTDDRWFTMADGPLYADARCLLGRNELGESVAAVTVWFAGAGKPGYLEPMGVHRIHRGRGYGRAITLAAARTLRELGASTAFTYTPASNVGAVATYESAGFVRQPETRDLVREA
ncbi:GNAT family N-acetyltransferase [Kribbella sandramycini]|uniref:GNAT family N-acetyltransferase n=1 Tax=Kribbella sandramycini TaxID=60450 RepID=A0A7Y4KVK1_9ACTN|nr:GNAT family N-acetyltransferase [Kribbella sandramycini]MBB6568751.1 ribosomal protein S18 acetylase RimI-like enzyme [Kribbella sandramycini]NOL38666.1 GNAT family N-acetyltransferase [Kribbella sandramycini]